MGRGKEQGGGRETPFRWVSLSSDWGPTWEGGGGKRQEGKEVCAAPVGRVGARVLPKAPGQKRHQGTEGREAQEALHQRGELGPRVATKSSRAESHHKAKTMRSPTPSGNTKKKKICGRICKSRGAQPSGS